MLDRFELLVEGLNHPEGVTWDPLHRKVYAGGEGGEIYAITLDGSVEEVACSDGSMLGLAVDGRGRVYACDEGNGEIVRWDPDTSKLETYARAPAGEDLDTPNACAFDAAGNLYVSCSGEDDPANASVMRVTPGGTIRLWTSETRL